MPKYRAALQGHEALADGTVAFHFERPAEFAFKAGQSISLELLEPPAEPNSTRRTFSLVSAPYEPRLTIATRMREGSAFKRALKALPAGARVALRGPLGVMTLHEDGARAGVFIAGGIGITPFVSMLREAAHERLPHRLLLLYSNRRPEDAAFLDELQALERRDGSFRLLATMTEMAKSARHWDGETRFIDAELLRQAVRGLASPVYYLVGPPGMVAAMRGVLQGAGIGAQDIRSEEFYGY